MTIRRVRRYDIEIDKTLVEDLEKEGVIITEAELESLCEHSLRVALANARMKDRLVLTPEELRSQREPK